MKYGLFKKAFGISVIEKVLEFETKCSIRDFQYCDEFNFFFLSEEGMGQINLKGNIRSPWFSGFNNASSFLYLPNTKNCLVVEDEGKMISAINLEDHNCAPVLDGKIIKKKIALYFSKAIPDKESSTAIVIRKKGAVCWLASSINRCFEYKSEVIKIAAGDGNAGYSLASDPAFCHLNNPQGMTVSNGSLYICDTGNGCIRKIKDEHIELIAGHPLKKGHRDGVLGSSLLSFPSQIRCDDKKAYILDEGFVKILLFANKEIRTIPGIEGAVDITVGPKRDLYFLREI